MDIPETKYAKLGDVQVAYREFGEGPPDLVGVPNWLSNVEAIDDVPDLADWWRRMSRIGRVVTLDQPGTGASDPVPLDALPSLEQWVDSTRVVMDDAGIERATLGCTDAGALTAALFAATYPDRTAGLMIFGGFVRLTQADDYPAGYPAEQADSLIEGMIAAWGTAAVQHAAMPDRDWTELKTAQWARFERLSASPSTVRAFARLIWEADVRHVLPAIRVPTLVFHRIGDQLIPVSCGRYIAENIPGARYVELPGSDHYPWPGDLDRIVADIEEFVTGSPARPGVIDRMLATILFTDIVGSTEIAASRGDAFWRHVLDEHDRLTRQQVRNFNGREVKSVGDGFLATFDGPARAIRAAAAIRASVKRLGLDLRAGLHTGECEIRGEDVGGIAVHIGARVAALADPGEILVAGTVKDLVIGSGIEFEDRGSHALKGVPGEWRLFAVRP